jgi:hypothetical protein
VWAETGLPSIGEMASDDYLNATRTITDKAPQGQATHDEMAHAVHTTYAPEINKGVGETLPDGRTITGKTINGAYPGTQPGVVAIDLGVHTRDANGRPGAYTAPMTRGRDTRGNEVVQTHLHDLMDNAKGKELTSQFLHHVKARYLANGGTVDKWNAILGTPQHDYQYKSTGHGGYDVFDPSTGRVVARRPGRAKAGTGHGIGRPDYLSKISPTTWDSHARSAARSYYKSGQNPDGSFILDANAEKKAGGVYAQVQRLGHRYGYRPDAGALTNAVASLPQVMSADEAKSQAQSEAAKVKANYDPPGLNILSDVPVYGTDKNGKTLTRTQFVQKKEKQLIKQSQKDHDQALAQLKARLARPYGGHKGPGVRSRGPAKTAKGSKAKQPTASKGKGTSTKAKLPVSALKEGVNTRFANRQVWTLEDGQAVRVK